MNFLATIIKPCLWNLAKTMPCFSSFSTEISFVVRSVEVTTRHRGIKRSILCFVLYSWQIYPELLCSWDKSLNIGSCLLRILLKVHSFTFDSLNCTQQIKSYSFYILVMGQKSFIISLCVCYNQRAKIILKSVPVH